MRQRSKCRHGSTPTTTLARSWLAHCRDGEPEATDLLPPPGVDAVLEALVDENRTEEKLAHALTVYAWECAAQEADLTCTLADVDALWDILESTGDAIVSRATARHRVTDAWVDAVAAHRGTPGIDPLSGLHTIGYLSGRIRELDRQFDDTAPLVILMIRWDESDNPWTRISYILGVADALHQHVRTNATLCQLGTHHALAMVPDDKHARVERGALLESLKNGKVHLPGVDVSLIPLPEDRSRVTELIVRVRDGSMVGDKSGPIGWSHRPGKTLD